MNWISVKDELPLEDAKVLAIWVSVKGVMYKSDAIGYFSDTIYACRIDKARFIIESHGPELPATHWMPQPLAPQY